MTAKNDEWNSGFVAAIMTLQTQSDEPQACKDALAQIGIYCADDLPKWDRTKEDIAAIEAIFG